VGEVIRDASRAALRPFRRKSSRPASRPHRERPRDRRAAEERDEFAPLEAIAEAVQRPTMKFVATKPPSSSTCRRSTACVSGWSVSAPASSIRSAPSCWSVPLPCGKACASCALPYHAYSPRPAMLCRPACCASSRTWRGTSDGTMSGSGVYRVIEARNP
jgi:hypothetical protein